VPVILISTDQGFSPSQTLLTIGGNTITLTGSKATSIIANNPRVIGDAYTDLTKQTLSVASGNSVTLTESIATFISAKIPRVIGDDYTNLTSVLPMAAITYAITDGNTIVTGDTAEGNASVTQTWTVS
jgi:hypothetical protein